MRRGPRATERGTAGTMNMQKPVAMPRGGITIFLEGHGGAALANAPGEHAGEADERDDSRDEREWRALRFAFPILAYGLVTEQGGSDSGFRGRSRAYLNYRTRESAGGFTRSARVARGHEAES